MLCLLVLFQSHLLFRAVLLGCHLRCLNLLPSPLIVLPRFFTAVTLANCAPFPPVLCDVLVRADCHAGISSGGCTWSIQVVLPPLRLGAQGFVGVGSDFHPAFQRGLPVPRGRGESAPAPQTAPVFFWLDGGAGPSSNSSLPLWLRGRGVSQPACVDLQKQTVNF